MTLCRRVHAPPELEEEAFRLADEWVEVDTPLSMMEYIYYHASSKLKEYIDEMDRTNNAPPEGGHYAP